jgi:hypothetical protein
MGRRLFDELATTLRSEGRIAMALRALRRNPAVGSYGAWAESKSGRKPLRSAALF